jgi:hypothetical protein
VLRLTKRREIELTKPLSEILAQPPPEAMEGFLASWYGPRTVESAAPKQVGSTAMPTPLRRFYDVIERWPDAIVQNVVLAPPELPHLEQDEWAETRIDDGKLVFYVENQGVCEWATSLEEADEARVWIRGDTLGRGLSTWEREEPPLSAFLVQVLVFEAVVGASHGASVAWLDRPTLARVVEPLQRLPGGAWQWPSYPSEFYAGDRILAVAGPNPGPDETATTAEYVSLFLGAMDEDALAYLDAISQPNWEWFSRRDGPATY